MKLDEIWLSESDSDKLADLLERYNKGLPYSEQKSFQKFAEDLLREAIRRRHKKIQADAD